MKKLELNKKQIFSLSADEMIKVNGGGETRSDRKSGHCAYSRAHPDTCVCDNNTADGNEPTTYTVGCLSS